MDHDRHDNDGDEKPRIKVTDRRKFTAEGDLRPSEEVAAEATTDREAASGPTSPEEAADATARAAAEAASGGGHGARPTDDAAGAASPASGTTGATAPPPDTARTTPPAPEATAAAAQAPTGSGAQQPSIADLPRDFTAFVEGMYLEAMLYLGALPDPRTGEVSEDLDMAKYKIDLLGMVQEKTRGNLTDEEAQQLEEVLYQLRMFYVRKGRGPGS